MPGRLTMSTLPRLLQLPEDESFFLFGPRGVGKTTHIKNIGFLKNAIYINLLKASEENRFSRNPDELSAIAAALPTRRQHIIIDEVQKVPKLLDIVHDVIEKMPHVKFILTGSSARKLRHGSANLLAGRAFVYHLFPFCFEEMGTLFQLDDALHWGMLPKLLDYHSAEKKKKYLEAYANTYLKEEIWAEKTVKKLEPFHYFLQVAAQCNGKIINFSHIARDVGIRDTTAAQYYAILEDTLLGFFLYPFQHSFRKRLSKAPKFFFFDPGIVRTLAARLSAPLTAGTSGHGDAFEHFIILQCKYYAEYHSKEYRFMYLKTKDDAEIDLVVERPGMSTLFIEIKSSQNIQSSQLTSLRALTQDYAQYGNYEALCFSRDPYAKIVDSIHVLPWTQGVIHYFT